MKTPLLTKPTPQPQLGLGDAKAPKGDKRRRRVVALLGQLKEQIGKMEVSK